MYRFSDVIGQQQVKRQLLSEIQEGRVPHAQLFYGPEGAGKLALALAYAHYLLCKESAGAEDACDSCTSCKKFNVLGHPDLHFAFPIYNKKASSGQKPACNDFLKEWRDILKETSYFSLSSWLENIKAENQQGTIYERESEEIQRKLSFKSMEGVYKCMIIWLPEKMNDVCQNKLLKILEEPTEKTVFLLVCEKPEELLTTILSRTQQIYVPKLTDEEVVQGLMERYYLEREDAQRIAHFVDGNFTKAIETIHINDSQEEYFNLFVQLMRLAYQRKIREMKEWSDVVAGLGRERQKRFLEYCQYMIRENFMYNFHQPELNRMNKQESDFSCRFAPFINEGNVLGIMKELNEAQQHVEQNVNAKIIFFDFALKMIVLLIQR